MKSLTQFITESRIDPQDVIDAILGAYEQWREDTKDEPGEWADIEDMYNANEPSNDVVNDICGDLGVDAKELEKFFKTPQGKKAWKDAQKEI